jgi:hypothetical protein
MATMGSVVTISSASTALLSTENGRSQIAATASLKIVDTRRGCDIAFPRAQISSRQIEFLGWVAAVRSAPSGK